MLVEKKDLLKAWQNNLSPSISRHQSIQSFVEDIVSPLLHILSSPNLRPVTLSSTCFIINKLSFLYLAFERQELFVVGI